MNMSIVKDLHRIAKKDQDSIISLHLKIGDKVYSAEDLKKYRIPTGDFQVVFDNFSSMSCHFLKIAFIFSW